MKASRSAASRLKGLVQICESLPDAKTAHLGRRHEHRSFLVRKKIFAYYLFDHHGDGRIALWCKAGPGEQSRLVEEDSRRYFVPPYLGPRGWVGVRLDLASLAWPPIAYLVGNAYRLTASRAQVARMSSSAVVPNPARSTRGVKLTHRDPRVDSYIEGLPEWQQAICRRVRALVHAADPDLEETIKRTRQPYFTLEGNVCALLAAKDWVNVFLYDGAIVPDPQGIITSGHGNKTARTVAIRKGERLNAPALSAMFKYIIANNRSGGWRKLKPRSA